MIVNDLAPNGGEKKVFVRVIPRLAPISLEKDPVTTWRVLAGRWPGRENRCEISLPFFSGFPFFSSRETHQPPRWSSLAAAAIPSLAAPVCPLRKELVKGLSRRGTQNLDLCPPSRPRATAIRARTVSGAGDWEASSNYLPRRLLNHADCRPHATDKSFCRDTLSFVSAALFSHFPEAPPVSLLLQRTTRVLQLFRTFPYSPLIASRTLFGSRFFFILAHANQRLREIGFVAFWFDDSRAIIRFGNGVVCLRIVPGAREIATRKRSAFLVGKLQWFSEYP